jgi:hypothetical protein
MRVEQHVEKRFWKDVMSRGGYENQSRKASFILDRVSERSTFVELAGASHNLDKSIEIRRHDPTESVRILLHEKFKQRPVAPILRIVVTRRILRLVSVRTAGIQPSCRGAHTIQFAAQR